MKKLLLLFVFVLCVGLSAFVVMYQEDTVSILQPKKDDVDAFFEKYNANIDFYDPKTTDELKELLGAYEYDQTPRIYVRNFPSDFGEKGDVDTFIRVLLPHILRQNELQQMERDLFLKLADKIKFHQNLTQKELAFFQSLVLKYEVLNYDMISQANVLYHRIGKISPSLAIAQALYATRQMKENLNAPFDVFRWNKNREYERVVYPDLAKAIQDYTLEINRGQSYYTYHNQRSIYRNMPYELPGRIFLNGLSLYKADDWSYTAKIKKIFEQFDDYSVDMASFRKGE